MNRLWGLAGALTLVSVGIAACGAKQGEEPEAAVQPVAQADFPTALANAICDNVESCCGQASLAYDRAACLNAALQIVRPNTNPNTVFDGSVAGRCVTKVAAGVAGCLDPWSVVYNTVECSYPYVGIVALGQPCAQGPDCAPSDEGEVYCGINPGQTATVCRLATALPVGSLAGDGCRETSECFEENGKDRCFPIAEVVGGPTGVCYRKDGLFCGPDATCTPLLDLGGSCSPDPNGGGDSDFQCVDGAYCELIPATDPLQPDTGVCKTIPSQGEACTSFCPGDLSCVCADRHYTCAAQKTCEGAQVEGGPCLISSDCENNAECACPIDNPECLDRVCIAFALAGLGEDCLEMLCAGGLTCEGTICQPLPGIGERCVRDCAEGICWPGLGRCIEPDGEPPALASCNF